LREVPKAYRSRRGQKKDRPLHVLREVRRGEKMIVRTSRAGETSFSLSADRMVENNITPYWLYRSDLRNALESKSHDVSVAVGWCGGYPINRYRISEGVTQRNKKFIQIGCKRFVGENRRRLIAWAKKG
jgi:hypothetical protein